MSADGRPPDDQHSLADDQHSLLAAPDDQHSFYQHRARDYVELHDQIETSVGLLDSLEAFLATFQRDLSAVSGQISNLQDRSKDIDSRLKGRRKIERPLASLITEIAIPPPLAATILDTDVGPPWLVAVPALERTLDALHARPRVKAARALAEVAEGLRIVAATKLRAFFLAQVQPLRRSMSTNMHVLQSAVLLKHRPLFAFLQRRAPPVAAEVQRGYAAAARVYYETGFRRYARALTWIKARTTEKAEPLGAPERADEPRADPARLAHADLDGPSVTLAYMADDKSHKEPIEALFRSLLLVLMDNGTAEYAFVTRFFDPAAPAPASPADDAPADFAGFSLAAARARAGSIAAEPPPPLATPALTHTSKEQQALLDALWAQTMEPVLEYCQAFARAALAPAPPPAVPLLTMIRLAERVLAEVQRRGCAPLADAVRAVALTLWPALQRGMHAHVESVRRLADAAGGGSGVGAGFLARGAAVRDATVQSVAHRYAVLFASFVALTESEEETMVFATLARLRAELARLIVAQSAKVKDASQAAAYQSTMYETLLQALSNAPRPMTHPKAQTEIAFWREREEEARRRIASVRR